MDELSRAFTDSDAIDAAFSTHDQNVRLGARRRWDDLLLLTCLACLRVFL